VNFPTLNVKKGHRKPAQRPGGRPPDATAFNTAVAALTQPETQQQIRTESKNEWQSGCDGKLHCHHDRQRDTTCGSVASGCDHYFPSRHLEAWPKVRHLRRSV